MGERGPRVALYQFYNFEKGKRGEVFALCARHVRTQCVPGNCRLERVANSAERPCEDCERDEL